MLVVSIREAFCSLISAHTSLRACQPEAFSPDICMLGNTNVFDSLTPAIFQKEESESFSNPRAMSYGTSSDTICLLPLPVWYAIFIDLTNILSADERSARRCLSVHQPCLNSSHSSVWRPPASPLSRAFKRVRRVS